MRNLCLAATGNGSSWLYAAIAVLAIAIGAALVVKGRDPRSARLGILAVIIVATFAATLATPSSASAADGVGTACAQPATAVSPAVATPVAPPVPPTVPPASNASITGVAWIDTNSDGLRQSTEPPAIGARMTILDAATDQPVTADVNGADYDPVRTVDEIGSYSFIDLAAGVYVVEVADTADVESDSLFGGDPDVNEVTSLVIRGSDGTIVFDQLAHPVALCAISAELPGRGHTMDVTYRTDLPQHPLAIDGSFLTFSVARPVSPNVGSGTDDSDFDPNSRRTTPITVLGGETASTIDLGIVPIILSAFCT